MSLLKINIFLIMILVWGSAQAELSGAVIARTCSTCHDMEQGTPKLVPPSLKGKTAAEITTAFAEFKAGQREATLMDRIVTAYSDAEVQAVATYIESLGKDQEK